MSGAIPTLSQYAFMAWCSVKAQGQLYLTLTGDELHNLYSSPNIIRVIKARRLRWAGHVARMGKGRGVYRVLVGKPEDETTGKT
jgi:hypothetical protein